MDHKYSTSPDYPVKTTITFEQRIPGVGTQLYRWSIYRIIDNVKHLLASGHAVNHKDAILSTRTWVEQQLGLAVLKTYYDQFTITTIYRDFRLEWDGKKTTIWTKHFAGGQMAQRFGLNYNRITNVVGSFTFDIDAAITLLDCIYFVKDAVTNQKA